MAYVSRPHAEAIGGWKMAIESATHDLSVPMVICPATAIQQEACACGVCGLHAFAQAKYAVNKRDAVALVDLIWSCFDLHPTCNIEDATWKDVADIAQIRSR